MNFAEYTASKVPQVVPPEKPLKPVQLKPKIPLGPPQPAREPPVRTADENARRILDAAANMTRRLDEAGVPRMGRKLFATPGIIDALRRHMADHMHPTVARTDGYPIVAEVLGMELVEMDNPEGAFTERMRAIGGVATDDHAHLVDTMIQL